MNDILHIYAQYTNHDYAFLMGDREALTALRNAIHTALLSDDGKGHMQTFTGDGEGYQVLVRVLPADVAETLVDPYTQSDVAKNGTLSPDKAWSMTVKE